MAEQIVDLPNHVLRIEEEADGKLKVWANRKKDGKEMRPLAYILGHNALIFKAEEKKPVGERPEMIKTPGGWYKRKT